MDDEQAKKMECTCIDINSAQELFSKVTSAGRKPRPYQHLLDLIKENPELDVIPMVNSECIQDDEYKYWMSNWGLARIDEYYIKDEHIYFKSEDFDELVDDYLTDMYSSDLDLSREVMMQKAREHIEKLPWEKAIIVNIEEY